MPAAVPQVLEMAVAPLGIMAWIWLTGGISRLGLAKNWSSVSAGRSGSVRGAWSEPGGEGLAGEVVFGRAEAAGDDEEVAAADGFFDGGLDGRRWSREGEVCGEGEADGGELLAEPGGVGVDGLAEDQFVADGEDDGVHGIGDCGAGVAGSERRSGANFMRSRMFGWRSGHVAGSDAMENLRKVSELQGYGGGGVRMFVRGAG